ncbi:MAG: 50S ribosomal protein L4 [Ignavibacteria bacterium CG08_land_8_20_14_0_20_37_9]|nr:MAG: 50S ribosomal protein L4 [Ignavibacteria bacterium CG08_land_8_20_14_0_20_37_9]
MMNVEMARLPRSHSTTPAQEFRGRFVPQARSGRAPHPPKVQKVWAQKINKKERRLAICSAIAASANKELIKYEKELPIIITDELQKIKKTSDLEAIVNTFGLSRGLLKAKKKKIRPGKGKMRGRKYRKRISLLFVIDKDYGIVNAATNLPGVDISSVQNLNVGVLAPGANAGRIVVWTESAIKKLDELFKV